MNIGIIGAGAWGTTLAVILSEKVPKVTFWCRSQSLTYELCQIRENKKYLPGIKLRENIEFTYEANNVQNCQHIFIAVPTIHLRQTLKTFKNVLNGKVLYSSIKGLEENSLLFPSQIIKEEVPQIDRVVLLMGPTLSSEIVRKLPTTFVVSSSQPCHPEHVYEMLQCKVREGFSRNNCDFEFLVNLFDGLPFRCYFNSDYRGVEFGGAIKNVYAIAFGILAGLELGFNAMGSLLSRILFEVTKLADLFNVKKETLYGISCLSDLITSGFSSMGRNFRVGFLVAKGKKLEDILACMPHIPEGIYTLRAVKRLTAKSLNNLNLPIANILYDILYNDLDPKDAVHRLISRPPVEEFSQQNFS